MKSTIVALFVLGFGLMATATETNLTMTVDGVTYSNVVFRTRTPYDVSIQHSTGIASIPLADLPPDLQKRFGYNSDKAEKYRATETETAARIRQAESAHALQMKAQKDQAASDGQRIGELSRGAKWCYARVASVSPQGLLFEQTAPTVTRHVTGMLGVDPAPRSVTTGGQTTRFVLVGHPQQSSLASGDQVNCYMARTGTIEYDGEKLARYVWVSDTDPNAKKPAVDPFGRTKQKDPNVHRLGEY